MKKFLWGILKFIIFIISFCIMILIINFFINKNITVTKYYIEHYKVSENFKDYKILQLTDIHSIRTEAQSEKIINTVKNEKPNIIFITGDLIDSEYYTEQNNKYKAGEIDFPDNLTIDFMKKLTEIASVYMVYGNHEMMLLDNPENNVFKNALEEIGVNIINNKKEVISIGEESIELIGVQDPATLYKDKKYADVGENNKDKVKQILDDLFSTEKSKDDNKKEQYKILLSHRPEYFDLYKQYEIDLALTGHTHGGIVALPEIGGLYAHPQGWFPEYVTGVYKTENFQMIVGNGLGYSKVPIRIFNPPEIISINLK